MFNNATIIITGPPTTLISYYQVHHKECKIYGSQFNGLINETITFL